MKMTFPSLQIHVLPGVNFLCYFCLRYGSFSIPSSSPSKTLLKSQGLPRHWSSWVFCWFHFSDVASRDLDLCWSGLVVWTCTEVLETLSSWVSLPEFLFCLLFFNFFPFWWKVNFLRCHVTEVALCSGTQLPVWLCGGFQVAGHFLWNLPGMALSSPGSGGGIKRCGFSNSGAFAYDSFYFLESCRMFSLPYCPPLVYFYLLF